VNQEAGKTIQNFTESMILRIGVYTILRVVRAWRWNKGCRNRINGALVASRLNANYK